MTARPPTQDTLHTQDGGLAAGRRESLLKAASFLPRWGLGASVEDHQHAGGQGEPVQVLVELGEAVGHRIVLACPPIGDQTRNAARHQAERVVRMAAALKQGLAA
ncbi:hypothetical protein [Nonomuraea turcica]|uniref:hypothetical protein n=1 Tax=Nonomuraea sp. G32 TaxID=3067274 RepID=UPI00273B6F81|nr:hypothetical protein [Nonomuraea sp. G32]MDP4502613.1 hypothetical protein [Nonomuraea sp. G32]